LKKARGGELMNGRKMWWSTKRGGHDADGFGGKPDHGQGKGKREIERKNKNIRSKKK